MDFPAQYTTVSTEETQAIGQDLARAVGTESSVLPRVVCLYGELGSGKTTLIQGMARGLGITDRLISPTFIIQRSYPIPATDRTFYHLDLYRLTELPAIESLGLGEIITDTRAIVVIEWAERLGTILPIPRIDVRAAYTGDRHTFTLEVRERKERTP